VQASEPLPEWYPFGQDTQVPPVSWLPRVQLATTEEIQQIFIVAKMQTNMVHEGFRCESMFVLWVLWVCLSCCGCRLVLLILDTDTLQSQVEKDVGGFAVLPGNVGRAGIRTGYMPER
jgi:hypothetical protein